MIVIDLTRPLTSDPGAVAGDPPVTLSLARTHEADGYQVTAVCLGSHAGTHLDAPRHFFPDGATLDSYPVDRLVRPGWVIDVRPPGPPAPPAPANLLASMSPGPAAQAPTDSLPLIGTAATLATTAAPFGSAVPAHESAAGQQRTYVQRRVDTALLDERLRDVDIEPGDFLLLWTGDAVVAADAVPLLLGSAAGLVGTDAPSLDDDPYPVHQALLGAGVLLAENLTNLDKLGSGRVTCAFLPLAIPDADGAPLRAVAWR